MLRVKAQRPKGQRGKGTENTFVDIEFESLRHE